MKFAQFLNDNSIPEWRSQYLDYKQGKKKLKKISKAEYFRHVSQSGKTPAVSPVDNGNREGYLGYQTGFESPWQPAASKSVQKQQHQSATSRASSTSLPSFQLPSPAVNLNELSGASGGGPGVGGGKEGKPRSFTNGKPYERTPLLEGRIAESTPAGSSTLTRRKSFIDTVLKRSASFARSNVATEEELETFRNTFSRDKAEFMEWISTELYRIDTFYEQKEQQARIRYLVLKDQFRQLEEYKSFRSGNQESDGNGETGISDKSKHKKIAGIELPSLPWPTLGKSGSAPEQGQSQARSKDFVKKVPTAATAKRQLKQCLAEYYRSLEMLKNYKTLNRTAFKKMMKKYDKNTNSSESARFMKLVDKSHFVTSDEVDRLMELVEQMYADYVTNGNRKMAVEKLRSRTRPSEHFGELFISGFLVGAAAVLVSLSIVEIAKHDSVNIPYLAEIWASFLLMNLMVLLFGVHFAVWDYYKINYRFIFEFNVHNCLDYRQYLVMPSCTLFLGSIMAYLSLLMPESKLPKNLPWIFLVVVVVAFLNPLPVMYSKSRRWLQVVIWRLLFSGFYPVEFPDFFLGDIFCSLTYSLSRISFVICIYDSSWSSHCGSNKSRVMGFLTTLPSIWRLLQCIRRYFDSGEWFPHLANMLKYLSSVVYYIVLSLYRTETKDTWLKSVFIVFATISAIYSYIWDIFMDWSLFQLGSSNKLLRNNLGYKKKNYAYYLAILADFLLRMQWLVYVFYPTHPVAGFGVSLAEVLRRFVWIFFRMENEHCTNVLLLKAYREVPLPYSIEPKLVQQQDEHETTANNSFGVGCQESHINRRESDDELFLPEFENTQESIKMHSIFRTISQAMTRAHAKDFQRSNKKHEEDHSSDEEASDEDDDDDEEAGGTGSAGGAGGED